MGYLLGNVWSGGASPVSPGISGDVVVAGDSLTDLAYSVRHYMWGLALTKYPPRLIYNAGVGGNTIDQLIARFDTDVIAYAPAACILRIGTNSVDLTQAQFETKYQTLLDSLATNNIFGVIFALPPKANAGTAIQGFNDWLQTQCEASPSTLKFVDDSAGLGDASYNAVDAYYGDAPTDVHPNGLGVYTMGLAMKDTLLSVFANTSPLITDGTDTYEQDNTSDQYVTNPLMSGTGGTADSVTGTVPDDWIVSASGSGTAATVEIVDADAGDANQTPWLRVNVSSVGGADHSITVGTWLVHPAIAADSTIVRLDQIAEVRFNELDCTNITSFSMFSQTGAGVFASKGDSLMLTGIGTLTETVVMRVSWPRTQGGESLVAYDANSIKLNLKMLFAAADTGPLGSFDIRCASVRGQTT